MNLAEFLLARIAEDEAVALEASWRFAEHSAPESVAPHIARHDPARVLADCEAKRGIVEADWRADDSGDASIIRQDVLRLLALPYTSHADYDESWRP